MGASVLDVTGLTFEDVVATLRPSPAAVRPLRAQYRRLLTGASNTEADLCVSLPSTADRVAGDEITKFVYRATDGQEYESVVVPMQHSQRRWKSVCVSSQVGCRYGCRFCQTATLGWRRDLSATEIVGQVLHARHLFGAQVRTVVFMGMGEPFDNLESVLQAIRVLNDRCGVALKMARLTVSTIGRVEGLRAIAALGWRRLNLAISLNAPNDELRRRLMPFAERQTVLELRQALTEYPLRRNQHFMIEYVLIPGINNEPEHARQLAELLAPVRCLVNVIAHNPRAKSPWTAPSCEQIRAFLKELQRAGQPCRQRVTRGRAEWAACGQLGTSGRLTSHAEHLDDGTVVRCGGIERVVS
jgi:23S rRNA (adenine2503-C2)-methyltransferase